MTSLKTENKGYVHSKAFTACEKEESISTSTTAGIISKKKEYNMKARRLARHGDENTVLKRGRKQVSASHKKRVYDAWKQKIIDEKIAQGIPIRKRGRQPKQI